MSRSVIAAMGHVALAVTDLDAAVASAESVIGLRTSDRADGAVDLTHGTPHHSLQLIAAETDALHHVGLVASSQEALAEIVARAGAHGARVVSPRPLDRSLSEGVVLEAPDGFVLEVYRGMPEDQPASYDTPGARPKRFGHTTFVTQEAEALTRFFIEVLDFRISDEPAGGCFLRCNSEHHGVGIFAGPDARMHHYAWDGASLEGLAGLADRLDATGGNVALGPVRHGAGNNVAVYFQEPSGNVVEYYSDMDHIYDDESYEPVVWDMDGFKWFSRWAPLMPEGWVELGVPRLTADDLGL